jgi:hypothetical protein
MKCLNCVSSKECGISLACECWLQVFKIPFHEKHASCISNAQLTKVENAACRHLQNVFNAHNPVVVVELEHAVHGTDTTVDQSIPSPLKSTTF